MNVPCHILTVRFSRRVACGARLDDALPYVGAAHVAAHAEHVTYCAGCVAAVDGSSEQLTLGAI